ncbi:MAG TPA: DNA/RNA helicase domain-containing protein [Jatrophihabitans sp.]|nr:DNA/RNA helicase domain-containing protein [Jatrophihabitans sp.]
MSSAGVEGELRAQSELRAEQAQLDVLYARLDQVRADTAATLAQLGRAGTAGTPAGRVERDALLALHRQNLQRLSAVEERLCIGRLDLLRDGSRYIGRIGLTDPDGGRLLLDWRAPAAQPFYRATPAEPDGAVSRRHLSTRGRTVTGIQDEVLDLDAFVAAGRGTETVSADDVLMLSLNAARTGRMRDIVATIQAEQDQIIRAPAPGVLVVQGGPGTGKTVVALHRAAYLLYAHRDRLSRSGVLVVGPNNRFLDYISQVLPSLGETGVVLATPGQLYPGIDAQATEPAAAVAVKGDWRMVRVLAAAVRDRQRLPREPVKLDVDGSRLMLYPSDVEQARQRAQHSRKPHNQARVRFVTELVRRLAMQLATVLNVDFDDDRRAELISAVRESPDVRREVNLCWMPVSPERLLRDLYADPGLLASVAPALTAAERRALARPRSAPWTPADVALLDEAAALLGEPEVTDSAAAARAAERASEVEYAGRVLDMVAELAPDAARMTTAAALAERYGAPVERRELAAEAAGDRSWAFGHLVVDEAQELSAMQWRVLMRRCPSRSMTVVGDPAQTGSPAGTRSWAHALGRYVGQRWRLAELTINYRTPGPIMQAAAELLAANGISATELTSARTDGVPPIVTRAEHSLAAIAAGVIGAELAGLDMAGGGRLAVIGPADQQAAVLAALPEPVRADERLSILTPVQAKGLEFDVVVLVEPAAIMAESGTRAGRGASDLYVAMTRCTRRLCVVHRLPLPDGLVAGGCTE